MDGLIVLFAVTALITLVGLFAVVYGADSRDGFVDEHLGTLSV